MGDPRLRYIAVSGLCLMLHNGLVIGLTAGGLHYVAASAVAFGAVAAAGFLMHAFATFAVPPSGRGFVRYLAAMALNLPLSVLLLWLLHDLASVRIAVAVPAATAILIAWNYLASRWALRPRLHCQGEAS